MSTIQDLEARAKQEQLELLIAHTPAAVAMLDRDMRYIAVSRRYLSDYRLADQPVVGRSHYALFPEIPERWKEIHQRCLAGAVERSEGEPFPRADGTTDWVRWEIVPWRDATGQVGGIILFSENITERRRAEETFRRHALFVQQTRDIILFIRRSDGRILDANDAASAAYGYPHDELLGSTIHDLRAPGTRQAVELQMAEAGATGVLFESVHRRRDGSTFPVEVSSRGVTVDGTSTLISVVRDVTERKQAVAALRETLERERLKTAELETVLDAVPAAVWIAHDPRGDRIVTNRFGAELLRLRTGQNISLTAPGHARPRNFAVQRGGRVLGADELPIQKAARGEPSRDTEFDIVFDDGEVRHILGSAVPLRDAGGESVGSVGAFVDVTDRKRAEEALREADRRKSEFLAVLSHELRNPLAPLRNSLYLLERAPQHSEQAARAREVLNRQFGHLTRLVEDLLDVTRISRGKVEIQRGKVDLRDVVRKATDDLRSTFEERGVTLRLEQAVGPVYVNGDSVRLAQVLSNLLQNAAKFTPPGGTVWVALSTGQGKATLSVRDTGEGMDPADVDRMFEPFAQAAQGSARTRGGLGLGLALVKAFTEMHGGTVRGWSAGPGKGAEFLVALPLAPELPLADPTQPVASPASARDIVVIEDNVDAGRTLAEVLEFQGHQVRLALDGRAGLALLRERPVDTVLCDIGLPDMSGYEVAKAIRADTTLSQPQLIALTGYAQPEDRRRSLEAGFDAHLAKPPPLEELEALLRAGKGERS